MNLLSIPKPVRAISTRQLVRAAATLAMFSSLSVAPAIEITPTFDSSITDLSYGADVVLTIRAAIFEYRYRIKETAPVSMTFKYDSSVSAGSNLSEVVSLPYLQYRALLGNSLSGLPLDASAFSSLPATDNPVRPGNPVYVRHALARALGYQPVPSGPDSIIRLGLDSMKVGPTWSFTAVAHTSLYATVCHEINEAVGLGVGFDGYAPTASVEFATVMPCDLFRYDQNNQRSRTLSSSAEAYFFVPGFGQVARVNQENGGDYSDWHVDASTPVRVQDWHTTHFEDPRLADAETNALDAIGYTILPTPVWVDLSIGSDSNSGNYGGGYFYSYKTIAKAVGDAGSGGAIMVVATGNPTLHTNRLTVTKPCKIVPFNGQLRIAP